MILLKEWEYRHINIYIYIIFPFQLKTCKKTTCQDMYKPMFLLYTFNKQAGLTVCTVEKVAGTDVPDHIPVLSGQFLR